MATPAGLPVMFALTNPKIDEREVAIDMFDTDPSVLADRAGQTSARYDALCNDPLTNDGLESDDGRSA